MLAIKMMIISDNTFHVEEYFMNYSPWGSCTSEAPPGGVCAPLIPENNALISPDP